MVRPKRTERSEIAERSKLVKAFWERLPVQKANRRTIMMKGFHWEAKIVERERRRTPRYPFVASAELIEEKADVRIASRVSELSLHGCYLDMMNPFPMGTLVLVKIAAGDAFFQAKGKIIYSQMNMGAGVSYLQIEPDSQAVLERWLDEAEKGWSRSVLTRKMPALRLTSEGIALQLRHEVIAGADAKSHDGERGILARIRRKAGSVHNK